MQAAFFRAPGEVELREVAQPSPRGREVLVRVAACGVCGSDLADLRGGDTQWHQLGHEYAGVVVAAGPEASLAPGIRVAAIGSLACGRCWYCAHGEEWRCPEPQWCGQPGFAEYACREQEFFFPVPGLTAHEGALIEPLTVAMELVRDGGVRPGASVCVIGLGPIGLMALALARALGAGPLYAVHPTGGTARIRAASALGAEAVFHPDAEEAAAALRTREPRGVEAVLLTAPLSRAMGVAVGAAAAGGAIAFVGMEWQQEAAIRFAVDSFHFRKLRLVGSNHNPCDRLYPEAARLLEEKVVDASRLVSHASPLTSIQDALDRARDRATAIKVMVDC